MKQDVIADPSQCDVSPCSRLALSLQRYRLYRIESPTLLSKLIKALVGALMLAHLRDLQVFKWIREGTLLDINVGGVHMVVAHACEAEALELATSKVHTQIVGLVFGCGS